LKAETWIKLGIKAEEIKQTPNDVLVQLNQANGHLPATLEKSAELYAEMRDRLSHSGRDFTEVGKNQQRNYTRSVVHCILLVHSHNDKVKQSPLIE